MGEIRASGGTLRAVAGRLRYRTPPEVGTILGPTPFTRELVVVIGHDDGMTVLGYASLHEIDAARRRRADGLPPRSLTETQL